jgi:hypothetical protein
MNDMMDQAASTARTPRTVPGLRIGPGLWAGPKRRYTLHDPRTGWYFRVGEHEHFLIQRLDGVRTLEDVEIEFAEAFERRLTSAHWEALFSLLAKRALLVGSDTPALVARLRDAHDVQVAESRTIMHARFPLVHADRFVAALAPLARRLHNRTLWTLTWMATAVLSAYVLLDFHSLMRTARGVWDRPATAITLVVVLWLSVAAHEVAHGLVAWLSGARDIRIGVLWRFPAFVPYCQVDDIVLFHNRWDRISVVLAGPTVSVAICFPFVILHIVTQGEGTIGVLATAMTVFGLFSGLVNLVPLFRMDGYLALSHAFDVEDLEGSSHAFLGALVRGRRQGTSSGPRDGLYFTYGVLSLIALTALVIAICSVALRFLTSVLPLPVALAVVIFGVLVTFAVGIIASKRARSRLADLPGTQSTFTSKWGDS